MPKRAELITKKTGILFLTLPTEGEKPIGIWGQRHLRYIKEHKRLFYVNLLTSGGLNSYLADINEQAEELFFRLVKQFAEKRRRNGRTQKHLPNGLDWRNG